MKRVLLLTTIGVFFSIAFIQGQNVFDPTDPIVRWNSGASLGTSTNPDPAITGLQKWVSVATSGISTGSNSFDASSFKAYFINIGGAKMSFRLKFPKSYTNPDSSAKKYPVMIFFHGAGEAGCPSNGGIYNNEKQLLNGGALFRDRVNNNQFDGFLIYPQWAGSGCSSDWGVAPYSPYYNLVINALDSIIKYARADIDKVLVTGLSNGGAAAWSMTSAYPQRVTKVAPSAAATGSTNYADFVHIPIWFATGGKDTNPSIGFAQSTYNSVKNAGADIRWTLYPDLGHAVWTTHWMEPDFIPYMNDLQKSNPVVYFQRYDYCPDSAINARIGITAGFYAYEWQKDGVTIATRTNGVNTIVDGTSIISYTGNEVTVRSYGSYRVRFMRTATSPWSAWSTKPAVIYQKTVTQTPPIQVTGLKSTVLPALDGTTTVPLTLPAGYFGYQWYRNDTLISTQQSINATAGTYKARIVEQFGCGSYFSPVFKVVNANGEPKPDPAKNLTAITNSLTSIQLDWSENPNAGENETGFEIYRSTTAGGPYQLIAINPSGVVSYLDQNLPSNKRYYYVVRAAGNFGAAAATNEATAQTALDNTPPSPPANFKLLAIGSNYAYVQWDAATDNVGVTKYDLYINGNKSYTTTGTTFTIPNLDSNQLYTLYVKARDAADNSSSPSNQVAASTIFTVNGINYTYYQGTWSSLPYFTFETPLKSGFTNNIDLNQASRADNFGFLWQAYLKVPTTANYTFEICSDDGSNLYVGVPYGGNILVNNDGGHSNTCKSGSIFLTAGVHPIFIPYFDATGGQSLTFSWQNDAGLAKATVPNSALFRKFDLAVAAPAPPTNLTANAISFGKINLSWTDNSSNESGFEIQRSTSYGSAYVPVATVTGTSFTDSNLTANTQYYYQIRSVGPGGESIYVTNVKEANWTVNNNNADANGNVSRALTLTNATYSSADKKEGTHSLSLNGTNAYATVANSAAGAFPSDGGYTQRTVALWIRPTLTNNKRVIFDFGNSTNGMGLRFNGTSLQAGVASGGTATLLTLSNFASNANWISSNWNHVAVVYNQNSLRIFLNGTEVAANNALTFSSIAAAASNNARFGYSGTVATDNVFGEVTSNNDYFSGLMDDIHVINGALTSTGLNALRNNTGYTQFADTTLAAPAVPNAPANLVAQLKVNNNITLTWNDNSNNENGFEVWRSVGNNTTYRLVAAVDSGSGAQKNFTDTGLFANVHYYYKVRAIGSGNASAYTNEATATTLNTRPVITKLVDFTMRFKTTYSLPVSATDVNGDALTFTTSNLPYFASLQPVSNGNVNIVFSPSVADQGAYTIKVYVSDGFNGFDTTYFTVVVNDNRVPVMPAVADVTMAEGDTKIIPVSANDAEGNAYLLWMLNNKPSFATFIDSGNGKGAIKLQPGFAASGTYTMDVTVDDGFGAWTSRSFTVSVTEKDPNEKIQVNMRYFTGYVPLWNDVDLYNQASNFNLPNLKNTKNIATTAGINLVSGTYGAADEGVQTGNNSGVYPDAIMKDGLKWGFFTGSNATDTLRVRVYGLDISRKYNFVFFSSNTCAWCGMNATTNTTFKIGNKSVQSFYYNNSTKADTIYQVTPAATGEVLITMIGDQNANLGGMLNSLVVQAQFDDSTAPAKPLNLAATIIPGTGVKLDWEDVAYNESRYNVYRATSAAGPYTLLNPGANNQDDTMYTDTNVAPFTHYYYYVAGANVWGIGASSDTVDIFADNNKPSVTGVSNLFVKTDATGQRDFSVSDDAGDVVTVTIPNKPSFITLQSLGSNNYRVIASPTIDNIGWYNLVVTATDSHGGVTTKTMMVSVADKNTRSVYVNFGNYGKTAPQPWNNVLGYGNAGTLAPALKDENNVTTTFSVQLVNGWAGISDMGHMTGNDTGMFPDSVLTSGLWDNSTTARQIRIAGLDNSKMYNLVFVGSRNEGLDASARYATGSISDTLNARNNTNLTANLNGLVPVSGAITVDLTKLSTATYQFLNGLQIEEYASAATILNPVNLYVEPVDRNKVSLSWSDRTNNENVADGFQLQRATDSLFSLNVVTINLPGNTTQYSNSGLTSNTKYWYRVRAKVGASFSDWSNREKTVTPQVIVYVNFNFSIADAPFPWNNTSSSPTFNNTYNSLENQSGQPSGVSMSIERTFNGENPFGVLTGNNSGVVPDNVLRSTYWLDNTQLSQIRVSGLNQSKRYRFGFIGSMSTDGWFVGDYTATYSVNGRTVYLNSWMNSTKVVYIGDVVPDANGEVMLNFSTTEAAAYGFNAGVIIEAYDDVNGGAVLNRIVNPGITVTTATTTVQNDQLPQVVLQQAGVDARIYPNPFNEAINLAFTNASGNDDISVDVYDLAGKLVLSRNYGKLAQGFNNLRLSTSGTNMRTGIYLVTLNVNGKPVQAAKLIKAK